MHILPAQMNPSLKLLCHQMILLVKSMILCYMYILMIYMYVYACRFKEFKARVCRVSLHPPFQLPWGVIVDDLHCLYLGVASHLIELWFYKYRSKDHYIRQKVLCTMVYRCAECKCYFTHSYLNFAFSWLTTYMYMYIACWYVYASKHFRITWITVTRNYLCAIYLITASKEHYWCCPLERYMCIHLYSQIYMQTFVHISAVLTCFSDRWG